jgi:hypothetical protein
MVRLISSKDELEKSQLPFKVKCLGISFRLVNLYVSLCHSFSDSFSPRVVGVQPSSVAFYPPSVSDSGIFIYKVKKKSTRINEETKEIRDQFQP